MFWAVQGIFWGWFTYILFVFSGLIYSQTTQLYVRTLEKKKMGLGVKHNLIKSLLLSYYGSNIDKAVTFYEFQSLDELKNAISHNNKAWWIVKNCKLSRMDHPIPQGRVYRQNDLITLRFSNNYLKKIKKNFLSTYMTSYNDFSNLLNTYSLTNKNFHKSVIEYKSSKN